MKKSDENKKIKEEALLDTAFELFTKKGFKETSIQDIVDNAGVGKGTFYLYFKDKYDIEQKLIQKKSQKLFSDALTALKKSQTVNFEDQIIFIIDNVINQLNKNHLLLKFISKNLSLGVYNETVSKFTNLKDSNEDSMYTLFMNGAQKNHLKLENPQATLFMIIELASSTVFNSILYKKPLPIEDFKPILYKVIKNILNEN
jgi:AcrR family transcriptional regulator